MTMQVLTNEQLTEEIQKLDSFRRGALMSLVALKASIQKSKDFDQQALEDCVTFLLAIPAQAHFPQEYELPLRALLADQSQLLKGTHQQE
ncbi:hypothetical protein [Paraburkholderia tropica]|uniref:hypothetical protein n=1 Tax=Paraburkholderia tropica TaxID=92647 RepID=UPI0015918D59|nr:hypothetical protein [Paraburkholderia tropica]